MAQGSRSSSFDVSFLPSRFVRVSMPRGRWVFDEDLSRAMWQQILRGPRPPSVESVKCQRPPVAAASPTLETVVVGRVRELVSVCSRPKPAMYDAVANQAHIEKLEGDRNPRRGESSSARFDCSVEASSGAEEFHCCRGGSHQGTPHEK